MNELEELLARTGRIAATFLEMASTGSRSVMRLSDEELAGMVGENALETAVQAHRIVHKLREAAGQLEVMAYSLNRRACPQVSLDTVEEVIAVRGAPKRPAKVSGEVN
ncbi:MAG TPA: hypothetical protein VGH65_03265 [Verrucomicrobiaceae bacterium]